MLSAPCGHFQTLPLSPSLSNLSSSEVHLTHTYHPIKILVAAADLKDLPLLSSLSSWPGLQAL